LLISKQLSADKEYMSPLLASLDNETASTLRAVIGRLSRRLRPTPTALQAGLTPTRISVLLSVSRVDGVRLSELAESEGINPTQLSRAVAELLHDGLIERSSDQGDRRAAWIKPTAKGKRLAERIRRERTDALNVALEELPVEQRRLIADALPALDELAEKLKKDPS
jgi:DNA-binding MarR family transcriptional regulator